MRVKELSQLNHMDFEKQVTFAYLACERVYPTYEYFSKNYNFGDPNILKTAIDFIYTSIFDNEEVIQLNMEILMTQVDNNIPFPDNFATPYATIAMNASGIIYESINLLKKIDTTRILADISTLCIDLIDFFIQEKNNMDYDDVDFELKILEHPLMQQETHIQQGIIGYLKKIEKITNSDVDTLKQLQKEGIMNLYL